MNLPGDMPMSFTARLRELTFRMGRAGLATLSAASLCWLVEPRNEDPQVPALAGLLASHVVTLIESWGFVHRE